MTLNRRTIFLGAALFSILVAAAAQAGDRVPFQAAAFRDAQEAGRPILVHIAATWCETCHAQEQVLNTLGKAPALGKLTTFVVDYDTQKDVMREFKASSRSTLIAFKGKTELGRLVGDTKKASIQALVQKVL